VEAMLAQAVGAWVHTVVDIALKGLLTQAAVVVVVELTQQAAQMAAQAVQA